MSDPSKSGLDSKAFGDRAFKVLAALCVVVFALAVFVGPGIAARRLAEESLGETEILRSTRSPRGRNS